eukprot:6180341-Pleurochrysis_carterae.AAC.1
MPVESPAFLPVVPGLREIGCHYVQPGVKFLDSKAKKAYMQQPSPTTVSVTCSHVTFTTKAAITQEISLSGRLIL